MTASRLPEVSPRSELTEPQQNVFVNAREPWSWASTNTLRGIPVCIPAPPQWNNRVHGVCRPNTTSKKKKRKKETPHYSDDTTQWKAPTGKCGQLALFTEDTANLFIQHQSTTFLRENLPHDFPCPIRTGGEGAGYQTCVALLNSNEFTPFLKCSYL